MTQQNHSNQNHRSQTDIERIPARQAAKRYLKHREDEVTQKTVKGQSTPVNRFARWIDNENKALAELNGFDLQDFYDHLKEDGYKKVTLRNYMTAVRQFLRYLERLDAAPPGIADKVHRLPRECGFLVLDFLWGMMTDDMPILEDHSDLSYKILRVVEKFIDEIGHRGCTTHFESALSDGKYLKGSDLGQRPERFVEDHLIFPLLREFGHSLRPQPVRYAPKWPGSGRPDFSLTTISTATAKKNGLRLFGESKTPNKLQYAREDMIEYLDKDLDFHAIVMLTDGVEWELWIRPLDDEPSLYGCADLKPVFRDVKARNLENVAYSPHAVREKIDDSSFAAFTALTIVETVRTEFALDPPAE